MMVVMGVGVVALIITLDILRLLRQLPLTTIDATPSPPGSLSIAPTSCPTTMPGVEKVVDEPTWRCQQNPFIGALGIQEPVILGDLLERLVVGHNDCEAKEWTMVTSR